MINVTLRIISVKINCFNEFNSLFTLLLILNYRIKLLMEIY